MSHFWSLTTGLFGGGRLVALTHRQQLALDLVRKSIAERGYPPTLREIGEAMGIRSTNGVNDHLHALERKGYISRSDLKSRAIKLADTDDCCALCGQRKPAPTPPAESR